MHVPVADQEFIVALFEPLCQRLGQKYGSVLPSGTPNGNGQVAPVVERKTRGPSVRELHHILKILLNIRNSLKKRLNLRIAAGFWPEGGFPMGVWETAGIKNEIGIDRNPVLEAKRDT